MRRKMIPSRFEDYRVIDYCELTLYLLLQAGEHDQLLKNTATLQRASQSLHRAQQVSADTGKDELNLRGLFF